MFKFPVFNLYFFFASPTGTGKREKTPRQGDYNSLNNYRGPIIHNLLSTVLLKIAPFIEYTFIIYSTSYIAPTNVNF